MKASDYIVSFFERLGINILFGYQGGMITHIVDSVTRNPNVKFIQVYHEQTAAIAAEGYARETGKTGVAISTSGPGATNMITGIADAWFDSIPVIYITGQVNTYEYKFDKPIRQLGFQETNIVEMVKGITKYATMIDNPDSLPFELAKAYAIANSGRKGPVLLDIPMDISRTEIDPATQKIYTSQPESIFPVDFTPIAQMLSQSSRPMIIAGGGVISSNSRELLKEFAAKHKIPVVCSLMGKGAMDEYRPEFVGMIGSYGNRSANMAVANADLLLVLGSRLDTRQTGAKIEGFLAEGAKIIHIDIDNNELLHHRLINKVNFNADVSDFLQWAIEQTITMDENPVWQKYIAEIKVRYSQNCEVERFVDNKSPYHFFQKINLYAGEFDIFCADIGQNQMWAAQTLKIKSGQQFFTSGGLAPMGYSMPAAIGAAFGNPNKDIWAFCGDGGFHIALQSLMLISQYNLRVKVVVLNNESLGMITQFQELYFNNVMAGTTAQGGYIVPSIKDLAKAYSLKYFRLESFDIENQKLMQDIISNRNCIIEYMTNGLTKVSPKLEFDKPISRQSPQLGEKEFMENMLIKN